MPDITPPDPETGASGTHSARSTHLGPYTALPFDDEPPGWPELAALSPQEWDARTPQPDAPWLIPQPEPAIPVPLEALAAAAAVDAMFEHFCGLANGAVTEAVRAWWLSIVGPRTCDCPDQHRWNCDMTPLWAQTIRALGTNPWTALWMPLSQRDFTTLWRKA